MATLHEATDAHEEIEGMNAQDVDDRQNSAQWINNIFQQTPSFLTCTNTRPLEPKFYLISTRARAYCVPRGLHWSALPHGAAPVSLLGSNSMPLGVAGGCKQPMDRMINN